MSYECDYDTRIVSIVANQLISIGVPPHLKGFIYLRDAIILMAHNHELFANATTRLYHVIAHHYAINASMVERSMRSAIRITFERSPSPVKAELFSTLLDPGRDRPTNAMFIATVAQQARYGL